jgi:hypothetical protein
MYVNKITSIRKDLFAQDKTGSSLKIFCTKIEHDNYLRLKEGLSEMQSLNGLGLELQRDKLNDKVCGKVRLRLRHLENLYTKY